MKLLTIILMLIILSTAASAYTITNTHAKGIELAANDRILAFVTSESDVDTDLNNDGDSADKVIRYYDISADRLKNTGREGRNPSVDGDIIAFEEKGRMIMLYDTQDKDAVSTGERGTKPSIYNGMIAFITRESDDGTDLNNDGDTSDSIVQFYEISSRNTTNTGEQGISVLTLDDKIVFDSSEALADEDYNRDNDKEDTIIQYYKFSSEDVYNTKMQGKTPVGLKESQILITLNNSFSLLDIVDKQLSETGVYGNDPTIYNDIIAYEKNSMLYIYRISTDVEMPLNISGKEPVIFGDTLAYTSPEREVLLLTGDDDDNDNIPDFADNCPDKKNAAQDDTDKDSIGDACETVEQNITVQQNTTNTTKLIVPVQYNITITHNATNTTPAPSNATQQVTAQAAAPVPAETKPNITRKDLPETTVLQKEKEDNENPIYWFVVAVSLAAIGVLLLLVLPGWIRKRRKGYGF